MASSSTTPVRVPSSASNYSQATLDAELRSEVNGLLLKDGQVTKIQEHILHALHSHSSNWPTAVQAHALALLRSGEVSTFPSLVNRVLEDIRQDTSASATGAARSNGESKKAGAVNGAAGASTSNSTDSGPSSLAIPQAVVDEALRITRESLETVVDIEDS